MRNRKPGGRAGRLVVVAGCGRLGAELASRLSGRGAEVVVVDAAEEAFGALSPEFSGFRLAGDATELGVLRQAGIERAEAVIAATGDDNTNMMVAQVAMQVFGVSQAIARVSDPDREAVYHGLGIQTVSPTQLAADMAVERLSGRAMP